MWSIGFILTMYDFPATKSMELLLTLKYFSHWLTLTEADPRRHGLSAASPLYDLVEIDTDVIHTILKIRNMGSNYYPTVKRQEKNNLCFSTSLFLSIFISEDYSLAHSYTL